MIVAGDFNTFWGEHEIALFMEASGLRSANREGLPSYPARKPRMELDFILLFARHRDRHVRDARGRLLRPPPAGLRLPRDGLTPRRGDGVPA